MSAINPIGGGSGSGPIREEGAPDSDKTKEETRTDQQGAPAQKAAEIAASYAAGALTRPQFMEQTTAITGDAGISEKIATAIDGLKGGLPPGTPLGKEQINEALKEFNFDTRQGRGEAAKKSPDSPPKNPGIQRGIDEHLRDQDTV